MSGATFGARRVGLEARPVAAAATVGALGSLVVGSAAVEVSPSFAPLLLAGMPLAAGLQVGRMEVALRAQEKGLLVAGRF
jgi:hypothetical protein